MLISVLMALQNGEGVVIVDAGGGTIDISSYRKSISATQVETYEEVAAPQCAYTISRTILKV